MTWRLTKEESRYLVAFQTIPGIDPATLGVLLANFGSFRKAWSVGENYLRLAGISRKLLGKLSALKTKCQPDVIVTRMDSLGIKYVIKTEFDYPVRLTKLDLPPWVLFYRGQITSVNPLVAVVGTRYPTSYGCKVVRLLVRELVGCGYGIISGLAKGIDTLAHQEAVDQGGKTLAVLGNGLDQVYPRTNRGLALAIINSGGGLVSEYGLGQVPLSSHFPARNRLIAALSLGVVVIEAGHRSGAKNTAWWARKLNLPLMVVPGQVTSDQSAGCHDLIREGARLVTSSKDILEEIMKKS